MAGVCGGGGAQLLRRMFSFRVVILFPSPSVSSRITRLSLTSEEVEDHSPVSVSLTSPPPPRRRSARVRLDALRSEAPGAQPVRVPRRRPCFLERVRS